MTQIAQHKAKVKELKQELAQAKAELEIQKQKNKALSKEREAVGSLPQTTQISIAETHMHVQLPHMPDMPDLPSTSHHDEEQQGPAPGALDPALSCPPAVTYLQSGEFEVYQLDCQVVMASLTWSSLYGSPMSISHQCSTSASGRSCSNLQALCQQSTVDISERRSEKVPRRSFAAATLLAVLVESYSAQEAQAARKKPAETTEKKPDEDKSLSGYDAKLLATYRRKEAMKEAMAKQREKAKPAEKPAVGVPKSLAKSASEAATTAESETPAASVAASATEAVKEAVKSVVPSSE
ncbi:hypothetical protein L7F22_059377 [Adiantum nelumboides]|nr:hypothetical protein [Adiantum nelumboides]